jgi:hypothetical protein
MGRRDRAIGIAAGIVLGLAVVAAFVFLGSEDTIDAPSIDNGAAGKAADERVRDRDDVQTPDANEGRKRGDDGGGGIKRTPVLDIFVRDGRPQGGVTKLNFKSGEDVRFRVISDTPGEVHVHGYEVYKDVTPGEPSGISFPAEFEGVFEVELHLHETGGEVPIAELEVAPG